MKEAHKDINQLKRLLNSIIMGVIPKNYDIKRFNEFNNILKNTNKYIEEKYGEKYTNNINILEGINKEFFIVMCLEDDDKKYLIYSDINLQLNKYLDK